jgi:hypothetical protein
MNVPEKGQLKITREGDRTVFHLPVRDWMSVIIEAAHQAQPGDKVIVRSAAQEKNLRDWMRRLDKPDLVVERGAKWVRFDAETGVDAKETAHRIMEHLRGIRARHRGESSDDATFEAGDAGATDHTPDSTADVSGDGGDGGGDSGE